MGLLVDSVKPSQHHSFVYPTWWFLCYKYMLCRTLVLRNCSTHRLDYVYLAI